MNLLLILFAFPIATIILASVLEKILNCPIAVAAVFFAIFLVVTFAFFDVAFLIATILYTILAFLSAILTRWICNLLAQNHHKNGCGCQIATGITANAEENTVSAINTTGTCNRMYRR